MTLSSTLPTLLLLLLPEMMLEELVLEELVPAGLLQLIVPRKKLSMRRETPFGIGILPSGKQISDDLD